MNQHHSSQSVNPAKNQASHAARVFEERARRDKEVRPLGRNISPTKRPEKSGIRHHQEQVPPLYYYDNDQTIKQQHQLRQ